MGFPNASSTSTANTAAVLHGAGDLRIEQRTLPDVPAPGYARVRVMSTTLCGSDLHYYAHGRNGTFALQHPMCLGHESSGEIVAITPASTSTGTSMPIGTRVAIECGIPCTLANPHESSSSSCTFCASGRYNLCPDLRFLSSAKTHPHLDGTLQSYVDHPIALLHPLPAGMSFDLGALAEPLGVVIHAARRAQSSSSSMMGGGVDSGDFHEPGTIRGGNVLVFGAGAVGLMACSLARAQGATNVVCVDVNDARLDFARERGFVAHTVNTLKAPRPTPSQSQPSSSPAQDLATRMQSAKASADYILASSPSTILNDHGGFDVVFECSGAEPCIQAAIYAARLGGKVLLVGMGTPNVALPLSAAACREVDLIGVFRYANTYPAALALLSSGALEGVEKMITHRFPLDKAQEAFGVMAKGVDSQGSLVVKVCVEA